MTKATKLLYLLLFFLTPLIFTTWNSELFEIPKMYFIYLITTLILLSHAFNFFRKRVSFFTHHPLNLPILLFLVSQIISTIQSIDIHTSFFGYYSRLNGGLLSLICFSLLFFILQNYLDDKFIKDILDYSLLSGLLVASYGILQHFGIDKNLWVQDVASRVFSTLGQPNWLGAYLCILLPLALHRLTSSKNKTQTTTYSLLITIFYLCLLFTKSKSAIIAAIATIAIYYLFQFKNSNQKILLTIATLFTTFSLTIKNPIRDQFFPPPTPPVANTAQINITPSEDIRQIVWQGALKLWQKFPLFGTGPETFAYSYYWVRPASHNLTSEWEFLYNKAHNEYLNFLATTGTIGTFFYFFFIYSSIRFIISQKSWGIFTALISILITNLAGFSVAIISLFFFLLPLLSTKPHPNQNHWPLRLPVLLFTLGASIYSLIYLSNSYLSDVALAQAQANDSQNQYLKSYQYLIKAYQLNRHEPVIISSLSVITSKIALAYSADQPASESAQLSDNAIKLSDLALAISPFNVNLLKERTQAYTYLTAINDQYYQGAIESLLRTAAIAPTDAKTFYLLGKYYLVQKDYSNAQNYFIDAIKLKNNYDHAYFELGKLYFDQKKYPQARENLEKTLKYAPTNTDAKTLLEKLPH